MKTSDRTRTPRRLRHSAAAVALSGGAVIGTVGFLAAGGASASVRAHNESGRSTVYTETNQPGGNDVLAYRADLGGGLTPIGSYPTGGVGTGASAASEGAVTLSNDGQLLAVVNGGSNSVSVFTVRSDGSLRFLETAGSGGVDPTSVTINGSVLYVLNAGNSTTAPNIAGIRLDGDGPQLIHQGFLNSAASVPEQISFNPDGRDLIVTEKASDTIDVFPVGPSGIAGAPVTTTVASGSGPYGFEFTPNGTAVVSFAGVGALATFSVSPRGALTQLSEVPDGQLAPCWVALSANGQVAFAANAHSGTISAYSVSESGILSLIDPAVQSSPGVGDTDLAVAGNGTLYVNDSGDIDAAAISATGSLGASAPVVGQLPTGTFGLAATGFGQGAN